MYLLIPAAGSGRRMGADRNKLLLPLLDRPILWWTLKAAIASDAIEWVGIICQPVDRPDFESIVAELRSPKPVVFIQGGDTRQASVCNGLQGLPEGAERVLIHDGARCLATPQLFDRCASVLQGCSGLIAAVPVKDTIKVVADHGGDRPEVASTPDRSKLWAAQTPQGFEVATLKDAHARGIQENWAVTDDAALFEKCELSVRIVEGEETNLKVTTPQDLAIAEFILRQRSPQA
ncbi:MAG: 2-C-methyl-D-erythritol 4-phosphate cytidylyltransferase [Cyanobacteria bacterium P01_D01_bin.73]